MTDNTILIICLIIYLVSIILSFILHNKLLFALSGILWLVPLIIIDNTIMRIFCFIMILMSFLELTKNGGDEYE